MSSLSFQLGPGAPDAASQLLLAREAKQLQNFPQNFTAWRNLGCCVAWPAEGGDARLTQVARLGPLASLPSCLFCQVLAAKHQLFPFLGPPPLVWWGRGGAQNSATRAEVGGGEGRAPVACEQRKQFLIILFQHVCDSCVSVPGPKNVTLELMGASASRDLGQKRPTGRPKRPTHHSHQLGCWPVAKNKTEIS